MKPFSFNSSRNSPLNDESVCPEGCKAYKKPQHQNIYSYIPKYTLIYSNIQKMTKPIKKNL